MARNKASILKKRLSRVKDVVIVTHRNPDGDAIGSSLGLLHYLAMKGKRVTVITPNDFPAFLQWMPGAGKILRFDSQKEQAQKMIAKAEIIFCLDFSALRRIEELGDEIKKAKAYKVLVDHHVQPEKFADFIYHDVNTSSTAQLVYELIEEMGEKKNINKDSANCLYTGIMTDTLSFRISTVNTKTHKVAAELMEAGAVPYKIHDFVYSANTEESIKLLGYALNEKMKVLRDFQTAYISLSGAELKRFNFRKGDTEGLVNYPLSISGVIFSVFFMEMDGMIKISLRSKGKFDVNKFARTHFSGGGHVNAAGGDLKVSLDEAINKFLEVLPGYKDELVK